MTCTAVANVSLYRYNIPNNAVFESPSTCYLIMQDDVTCDVTLIKPQLDRADLGTPLMITKPRVILPDSH